MEQNVPFQIKMFETHKENPFILKGKEELNKYYPNSNSSHKFKDSENIALLSNKNELIHKTNDNCNGSEASTEMELSIDENKAEPVNYTSYDDLASYDVNMENFQSKREEILKELKFEYDWKRQFEAVNTLRQLNKFCKPFLYQIFDSVLDLLPGLAFNLKSNISKNTLVLIEEIFLTFLDEDEFLDEWIEKIIAIVIKEAYSPKNFIAEKAKSSLFTLAKNVKRNVVICSLLDIMTDFNNHKSSEIAAKFTVEFIQSTDVNDLYYKINWNRVFLLLEKIFSGSKKDIHRKKVKEILFELIEKFNCFRKEEFECKRSKYAELIIKENSIIAVEENLALEENSVKLNYLKAKLSEIIENVNFREIIIFFCTNSIREESLLSRFTCLVEYFDTITKKKLEMGSNRRKSLKDEKHKALESRKSLIKQDEVILVLEKPKESSSDN